MSELPHPSKKRILAHRGLWNSDKSKQNSVASLVDALESGFGIETDLRDANNQVVLSHDPAGSESPYFSTLLTELNSRNVSNYGPLALNIKSDGLVDMLPKEMLNGVDHFYFDMSTPQLLRYLSEGMPVASRVSEYEPLPDELQPRIWLDAFNSDWYLHSELILKKIRTHRIFIVSPELHGRDKYPVWAFYRNMIQDGLDAYLCTDHPEEAFEFLCQQ